MIAFNETQNNYTILKPLDEFLRNDERCKELLGIKFTEILNALKATENKHKQIINASLPSKKVKIKQDLAKDFKELWDLVNKKAKIVYKNIQHKQLIDDIANAFRANKIAKEHIIYEKKMFNTQTNTIQTLQTKTLEDISYEAEITKDIHNRLLDFVKETQLPLSFLIQVYNKLDKTYFYNSPFKAFESLKTCIKESIHTNLLQSIDYDFSCNIFSSNYYSLIDKNGNIKDSIDMQKLGHYREQGQTPDNYLYEDIICDSNIEKAIIEERHTKLEHSTLKVFAKLPKLSIPTPYKNYEPDFAYLLENSNGKKIFFICESKGYDTYSDIPKKEQQKIDYAKVFFDKLQQELKESNIQIIFETRINKQALLEVLKEALQRRENAKS